MPPLVLALEPDLRQAAIVKRIVREKVLAEVAVVDSRDAALEAMRTTVPDVLLLSALLSPRDEDELFAHLRTLQHAEHLQTHTIPQLASTIGHDDEKPSRGLLSAFRRRKGTGTAPAGCDPDLFAEEIRTYLQRAAEKKRELRENPARETAVTAPSPAASTPPPSQDAGAGADAAAPESSWASPFEWRPARSEPREPKRTAPAAARPAPRIEEPAIPSPAFAAAPAAEPRAPEPSALDPVGVAAPESVVAAESEPVTVAAAEPIVLAAPPPEAIAVAVPAPPALGIETDAVVVAAPQSVLIPQPRSVLVTRSEAAAKPDPPRAVPRKLPLSKRHAREWWFEEQDTKTPAAARETDSEMRQVLGSLSVPLSIAAIGYAEGCRIRRVRLTTD
jgi:CheY-like chemotaxis protein